MARITRRGVVPASTDLGRFVRQQRELASIAQTDLATEMGWSVRTMSSLENGRRPLYNAGEVLLLAKLLEVGEETILAFSEQTGAGRLSRLAKAAERLVDEEPSPDEDWRTRMQWSAAALLEASALMTAVSALLVDTLRSEPEAASQALGAVNILMDVAHRVALGAVASRLDIPVDSEVVHSGSLPEIRDALAGVERALSDRLKDRGHVTSPGEEEASAGSVDRERGLEEAEDLGRPAANRGRSKQAGQP